MQNTVDVIFSSAFTVILLFTSKRLINKHDDTKNTELNMM
jgi:hypothetical protein